MIGVNQVGASIERIYEVLPDNTAGSFVVGNTTDDVIQITGLLKSGNTESKVILTLTNDTANVTLDVQITPFQMIFAGIFTGAAFNGDDIEISYTVGALGNDVILKGIIERFKE